MANKRKQIAFDLYADKDSPIFKYFDSLSFAYYYIEKVFKQSGFPCHRQGSVYTSTIPLSQDDVTAILESVCEKIPWLDKCTQHMDITDICRTHDILDIIRGNCLLHEEKRKSMERSHKEPDNDLKKE